VPAAHDSQAIRQEGAVMIVRNSKFKSMGGIHPRYHKTASAASAITPVPPPAAAFLSLAQHIGAPSKLIVKKGDAVKMGQVVAEATGFVSACLHSPVSGVIKSVEELPTASGRYATVLEITSDGKDEKHESCQPVQDWTKLPPKELIAMVAKAGIVGMGGAGFPTHVKLSPPAGKTIDTLILNGAECEPFLTADHRLMAEQAKTIWQGVQIIRSILGARSVCVAVEDNKPDAIRAMENAMSKEDDTVELVVLKTEYPQGAEKQLIYSVTGRQVPSGGLPMDVGALVENVSTAAAIAEAVTTGMPLIQRVVTVTGQGVKTPNNLLARIGTSMKELVDFCGGLNGTPGKIISGGPMMGIALPSLVPGINKTTSGILILPRSGVEFFESMPCISCGRCVGACPMRLMPCSLSEALEAEDYTVAENFNVLDCIECGSCAFECPAHRPLVQHMKQGKAKVTAIRRERMNAAKAGA
jgi:Na+-translocating ferredoxin:NAD+ oxidoreductase subunit C